MNTPCTPALARRAGDLPATSKVRTLLATSRRLP
jgi:hypothetical protein